ncbi:TPA: hypothetical protein ACLA8T_000243 [Neisseria meningitidis]
MPSERSFRIGYRDIRNAGRLPVTAGQAVCFAGIGEGKSEMRVGVYFDAAAFRRYGKRRKSSKSASDGISGKPPETCRIWVTR